MQHDTSNSPITAVPDPEARLRFFFPPLFEQRRSLILATLREHADAVDWLIDMGCCTASLACILANSCLVSRITGVDVDKGALDDAARVLAPQPSDYDRLRERPLTVELIHGSIVEHRPELHGVDAIVLSEVIEHLDPPDLERLPEALFAMYSPKLVIVSTPNVEFNVHFPDWRPGIMRDADHRFEWTRTQFESWCTTQATQYGYNVTFSGVGLVPTWSAHPNRSCGFATQFAVFVHPTRIAQRVGKWPVASRDAVETTAAQTVIDFPYYQGPDLVSDPKIDAAVAAEVCDDVYSLLPRISTGDEDEPGRNTADPDGTVSVAALWNCVRVRQLFRTVHLFRVRLATSEWSAAVGVIWTDDGPDATDMAVEMDLASGGYVRLAPDAFAVAQAAEHARDAALAEARYRQWGSGSEYGSRSDGWDLNEDRWSEPGDHQWDQEGDWDPDLEHEDSSWPVDTAEASWDTPTTPRHDDWAGDVGDSR
ncbi:Small RNA 2'-O-methyltransferase [Allomyces arbusculus]|nr:Small RNA 2'-O-methyltransferase [Allomyces arbusculus]